MGIETDRVGFYLPGGGSSGIGGDDEPADIDKINENFQLLDQLLNVMTVTSTTRPSTPINGQIIFETDTEDVLFWSSVKGKWYQMRPHVGTTAPPNPQEGYLWADTSA